MGVIVVVCFELFGLCLIVLYSSEFAVCLGGGCVFIRLVLLFVCLFAIVCLKVMWLDYCVYLFVLVICSVVVMWGLHVFALLFVIELLAL